MKNIKEILFYIWQLPQNLIGLFLLLIYQKEKVHLNNQTIESKDKLGSSVEF